METRAARALAMMQARAEASSAKALGLALLAADYAAKINAVRQEVSGDELAARLTALMAEQRAAERALVARLAGEAKEKRGGIAKAYNARRRDDRVRCGFRPVAVEVATRATSPDERAGKIRRRIPPAADPKHD